MPIERREFLGLQFDVLDLEEMVALLSRSTPSTPYAYVVTPNVDHIVRIEENAASREALRPLYEDADYRLCDSKILHTLAKFCGVRLPVVPGSELTARLFRDVIKPGDRIAVIGGNEELMAKLRSRYRDIEFLHHSPPMGLRTNPAARARAAEFLALSKARFAFIAVGSPQQEMIAAEAKRIPMAKGTALCIGISLEFLTGLTKRAPRLMQRMSLEWAHRLLKDPKRLARRYLIEGPRIFLLAYRWRRGS